jgi:ADP-L-glycero-D-manno-heptose 6-epimerase
MQHVCPNGIYNAGTGEARTFLDLAHALFAALDIHPAIEFIPTPENIRDTYQYYTQAEMDKLRSVGYHRDFCSLEQGVAEYVREFLIPGKYY